MSALEIFGANLGVILGLMSLIWLLSLAIKDASIVDIFWGSGFVVSAWVYFLLADDGFETRKILITAMATIWGLRLTLYLGWRNIGKGEDFRYQKWREQFGERWWWLSFFRVFVLQGVIMWLVSTPLLAAQVPGSPDSLTILDILGVSFWGIGLFFETVGDLQLAAFKANPDNKGKVLDTGLWRYTRHPNYFGDAMVWWGLFLVALATPGGWVTVYAPAFMTLLLMRVSGVAMLERTLVETKPQYREYIETTNAFIPWFPKKKQSA